MFLTSLPRIAARNRLVNDPGLLLYIVKIFA